jgi:predicted AAA+ superfamily ATPase
MINITGGNVGRIAERIVANELEARGFRVSDVNKDRVETNVDLLAVKSGHRILQIQVKGATNKPNGRWWIQYGHFSEGIIYDNDPIFNRAVDGFYTADVVICVAVKSPIDYSVSLCLLILR